MATTPLSSSPGPWSRSPGPWPKATSANHQPGHPSLCKLCIRPYGKTVYSWEASKTASPSEWHFLRHILEEQGQLGEVAVLYRGPLRLTPPLYVKRVKGEVRGGDSAFLSEIITLTAFELCWSAAGFLSLKYLLRCYRLDTFPGSRSTRRSGNQENTIVQKAKEKTKRIFLQLISEVEAYDRGEGEKSEVLWVGVRGSREERSVQRRHQNSERSVRWKHLCGGMVEAHRAFLHVHLN